MPSEIISTDHIENQSVNKNNSGKEYVLSDAQRERYRELSKESRLSKLAAKQGLLKPLHNMNTPKLNPEELMPQLPRTKLSALSLFSGGGGLDLGFDRAGFEHVASYEIIPICENTLRENREDWKVYAGVNNGDVRNVRWDNLTGTVDVVHGGPPCQPFSIAGEQKGIDDDRNMWGEFSRAVNSIKPKVFVAENVPGLMSPKFEGFVNTQIIDQLSDYQIVKFQLHAADFGVPQIRRRIFFVGFKNSEEFNRFSLPRPTHSKEHFKSDRNSSVGAYSLFENELPKVSGVREALGLPEIGYDDLAPTIRSAFTGKRNTTSVLNSSAGQVAWAKMEVWPNGVQASREGASAFPAKNGHFRMSIQDVALLQGFPQSWKFGGAVYQVLGQIGNSVVPPMAYQVAVNVMKAIST